jgi:hypothetical protein
MEVWLIAVIILGIVAVLFWLAVAFNQFFKVDKNSILDLSPRLTY